MKKLNIMDELDELKKSAAKPAYFFYGEEKYLIDTAITFVRKKIQIKTNDINYNSFAAKGSSPQDIVNIAQTIPMFSKFRLIIVSDTEDYPVDKLEPFMSYLKKPSISTVLIFTGDKADGRSKFYKELSKIGGVLKFDKLYEFQVGKWIAHRIKEEGYAFESGIEGYLSSFLGTDLGIIEQALQILFIYCANDKKIKLTDVDQVIAHAKIYNIFELTDAIGNRDVKAGLLCLNNMLEQEKGIEQMIFNMIVRHFRQLLKLKQLIKNGESQTNAASLLRLPPFILKKLAAQIELLPMKELLSFFRLFYLTDVKMKSENLNRKSLLEGLIFTLCRPQARGALS